jgi:hypothetical protein
MPLMPRGPRGSADGVGFDEAWQAYLDYEGDEFAVYVENVRGTRVNGGGRTISSEGLDRLREQMTMFVASRLKRRMDAGLSAPKVRVTVKVEFE